MFTRVFPNKKRDPHASFQKPQLLASGYLDIALHSQFIWIFTLGTSIGIQGTHLKFPNKLKINTISFGTKSHNYIFLANHRILAYK
jgi:hypothetical protein